MEKLWRFFERLVPPFPAKSKGEPPAGLVRFIFFYTSGLWKFLLLIACLTALMAAGEALFFSCMGLLVDWTADAQPQAFFARHSHSLWTMLILAAVVLPVATILHSLILHQSVSGNFPMQIRWQVHRYMLGQSLTFFSDEFAGRVANKVMQTAQAVRTSVLKLIDVLVHMLVYLATMIYMLAEADLTLALPLVVWLIAYSCAIFYFIPRLRKQAQVQADTRSDMVGRIVDSYVNISTVKLFGGKGRETKYARAGMEGFIKAEYGALRILTLFDVSVQLLNYALLISTTALALYLWHVAAVTSGGIAVAVAIAIRIINMSRWMMWEVGAIFENIGTVYDGIHTIAKPLGIKDPPQPKTLPQPVRGELALKQVTFAYVKGKPILQDFNLLIKPGEKLGIVGPSGAGKTTIINLLLRFYDVEQGEVTIDGINVKDLLQDELRDCFAMVAQDPSLMHRTVRENISYGTSTMDANAIQQAAQAADALSFIEQLSDYRGGRGFETMVGERGVRLSGGQRQRIALARVVMKDAPILILDEATSALDSESEQIIQENLGKVMHGRTVIAIAHRLSTLAQMDRIVVIDSGRIVESGTQAQLLQAGGLFARLWQRQTGGFIGN
ncbi:MAG: ABC transporter ATP-binding protein/permease [Candidatus Anaerobiospirillum merdipullorum]|uniref:ABC transporter ATP-binding protein/permease n=1 Tax=Candidatus Anaerobiospirillum merdipullorum TaxID=2838450 RepID=A0A9E2NRY4_9GAMM|nr:ABC transporter ATP-binding protein/permease [Candidatus Anaerobiospirillum merdipullorum]